MIKKTATGPAAGLLRHTNPGSIATQKLVTVVTVTWQARRDNLPTECLMPVLVLGVFSFLLFIAIGVLAISAVMSERNHDSHEEPQGKA